MISEKEIITTVYERAEEREQGLANTVENLRQEEGGIAKPEIPISAILSWPQHTVQIPVIQEVYLENPILDQNKPKGDSGNQSTWNQTTVKRIIDKGQPKK